MLHAKKGNVQQLLDALRNVDNINCVNRQGFTPLMIAANSRMRACMQLLIDRKADVNARGHAQYTPLHWMAYTGYVDELRMLLNAGADVKARDNSRGQTPLHWAVRAKHLRAAQVLLEHASVPNASDSTHRTALHQAASGNDAMMISLLLFYGASTRMRDQSGKLPVELLRDRSLIELFRAWESDDMSQVADAAKRELCTFAVTGTELRLQFFFACETCKLGSSNGGGVCVSCRRRCHAGHAVSTPHLGLFYCDCGAHVERYHCNSLTAPPPSKSLLDLDEDELSSSNGSAAALSLSGSAMYPERQRPRAMSSPSDVLPSSSPSPPPPAAHQPHYHSDRAASPPASSSSGSAMPLSPLDLFGSEPAPRPQSPLSPRAPAAQVQPVVIGFLSASTDGAVDESSDAASHAGLTGKQRDLSAWLDSLDLLFLDELFRKQRTDIDTVRYLGKEDLLEHGVVGIGPLKKLLVEIERLRTHGVKTPHCELPPMAPPVSSPPLSPTVQRVASTPSTAARKRDADDGTEVAAGDGDDDGDNSIVQLMRSGEMTASGGSATEAMAGSGSQSAGQLRRALNAQRHLLSDIRKTRSIGEGAFGQVFEGVWQGTTRVAMKRLSDATHARAFEKEANLLRDLRHPNVVMFLGLFRDERGEMWIVTEFLSLGSLRHLLHRDGARVTSSALLLMAKDAAAGMKYLSQNRILHRDLAARNLLVKAEDKRFVVKVADFGLSRVTDGTTYYSRSRKFPVKWTAPEALQFAKFTSKSDVWSFGVVLWEMYEFGKVPYHGMSNRDAMQFVLSGNRLPRPDACPADLYRLMLDCWRADAQQRPSFQQIYDAVVEQLMRDTHPTVFSLNAADGQVRGRPTAVLDAAPDEAYYADESGVQITRPVRAEVADYVEPEPTAAAAASNNRNASDAFRAYAVASMYRSADGGDRSATSSEAGGDASAAASSSASTFGLSSAMPSIFTLDPARLTTRELTSMIDFDSDKRGIASPPQQPKVDEIRDSHGSDDSDPYEYDDDDSRDHSGAAGTSRRAIRAAFPDYDDEVGRT